MLKEQLFATSVFFLASTIAGGLNTNSCSAIEPNNESTFIVTEEDEQKSLTIEVIVKDSEGKVVEGATIKPWALRCGTGHGLWNKDGKRTGGLVPKPATTDETGKAIVHYPRYADLEEKLKATLVTVFIDHLDHPSISSEHIELPVESSQSFASTWSRN